jgi:hypothetical protein
MIRPEHIRLCAPHAANVENRIDATVAALRFYRATTVVELDAVGLSLEALVLQSEDLRVGQSVAVSLAPDRIVILGN